MEENIAAAPAAPGPFLEPTIPIDPPVDLAAIVAVGEAFAHEFHAVLLMPKFQRTRMDIAILDAGIEAMKRRRDTLSYLIEHMRIDIALAAQRDKPS